MAQHMDRRLRRRQETVEEIVEIATTIMAEHGAGGLSLGEVARRMGIRTPSLYGYFDSKNALYDALFERGWRMLNTAIARYVRELDTTPHPVTHVLEAIGAFVRWAIEHPAYAQLMFWRPVPGFQPSAAAYAPAIETSGSVRTMVEVLRDRGVLAMSVDVDEAAATCTVLVSGVISQQLANAPQQSYDEGTFTRMLPQLVSMYLAGYGWKGDDHVFSNTAPDSGGSAAADAEARGGTGGRRSVRGSAGTPQPAR